ncbi:MAG: transposase [Clostridia bacterium]|nr:transposase [Clostridia bacterium]
MCKLKSIPENLNFIVDGNPTYLLAQHFFASKGTKFDVTQVIELTKESPVSRECRPLKQIIERLNEIFKGKYKYTRGFISFVNLFTVYFNFLRPHSTLNNRVPVAIPYIENLPHMPARWCKLIQLAQEYIMANQPA